MPNRAKRTWYQILNLVILVGLVFGMERREALFHIVGEKGNRQPDKQKDKTNQKTRTVKPKAWYW